MLSTQEKITKRVFDIIVSAIGLLFIWWFILLVLIISSLNTKKSGIIALDRVGINGKIFKIFKIRTMIVSQDENLSSVTIKNDERVTRIGQVLRQLKIDELPQLVNVLIGNMSFVGPRPDVQGFADELTGGDKIILSVKPGITGPASIYFKNEEEILAKQEFPEKYNRSVIWPKKIELNKAYVKNYKFLSDIEYILKTIF